jgi:hypothetical protein
MRFFVDNTHFFSVNRQYKGLAPDQPTLMGDTILDSLPLAASQYPLQASLCADGGTTQRKTATSQLERHLEVRHYCRRL